MALKDGLRHLVHDSWTVDDLLVTIKGVQLNSSNILSYEVFWGGSIVPGIISFQDNQNLMNVVPLAELLEIEISFTSQKGSKAAPEAPFKKTFITTKILPQTDKENNNVVEIYFQDQFSFNLQNTFRQYSAVRVKPSEFFEEFIDKIEAVNDENLIITEYSKEVALDFISPAHVSAYEYLQSEFKYRGYNLIQDKHAIYIVHDEQMEPDLALPTEEIFFWKPLDRASRIQILEYDLEGFNSEAIKKSMPAQASAINTEASTQSEMSTKTEIVKPTTTAKAGSYEATAFYKENGDRQTGSDHSLVSNSTQMKALNKMQQINIWVPGWNGNRVGMTVDVEIPLSLLYDQNQTSETVSGKWIVDMQRDKIIGSFFVQELRLSRPGVLE